MSDRPTSPRVMVDMSLTLLHHGHIRILKEASQIGWVVVALTIDDEVRKHKGYDPELTYEMRHEILSAIRYVDEIVPCTWLIDDAFLDKHRIDFLLHGDDNTNVVAPHRLRIIPRTAGISSTRLRARVLRSIFQKMGAEDAEW